MPLHRRTSVNPGGRDGGDIILYMYPHFLARGRAWGRAGGYEVMFFLSSI